MFDVSGSASMCEGSTRQRSASDSMTMTRNGRMTKKGRNQMALSIAGDGILFVLPISKASTSPNRYTLSLTYQPSTSTFSSSCHAKFRANLLQSLTISIEQFSWKWTCSHASGVCLHHTDDWANCGWWNTQTCACTANCWIWWCDVRIST